MKYFKNNFALKFVVTLFLIGLIIGFGIHYSSNFDSASYIEAFKESALSIKVNTFLPNILIICAIFLASITVIGIPICLGVILYESISIGFTIATFLSYNGLKSGLFYITYFSLTKFFHIILILYFIVISMKFSYKILRSIYNKDKQSLYSNLIKQFYRFLIVLTITVSICLLTYFFSGYFIQKIIHLLVVA